MVHPFFMEENTMNYKLVALDCDGTLLGSDGNIPKENITALHKLKARGIEVVLATGRSDLLTKDYVEDLGIDVKVIGCNGATLSNVLTGERLYVHSIDRNVVKTVLRACMEKSIPCKAFTTDMCYTSDVIAMEKGKERWGMIADDIWDMILGKAGKLPGELAPEIVEKAEREGRKFFTGNPQDNYPDCLDKYRKMMKDNKWELGEDDEELFEYAMHPAQYEAYKSGKAKEDFLADVEKRRAEQDKSPLEDTKPKTLTVQVEGQSYRVTVAYGDIDLPASATEKVSLPAGEGTDVLSPLEGKFFLTKNTQETPRKVGDQVKKGDLLGYIDSMKTYNAIRSDIDGTIVAICVNSGDSVSEDDVLMKIA